MSKIYNEIVIDMNPESPTFEETLYEDSFEYNGDMMLMQEEDEWASIKYSDEYGGQWSQYQFKGGKWKHIGTGPMRGTEYASMDDFPSPAGEDEPEDESVVDDPKTFTGDPTSTEWGAADIGKDDFINPDGTPKSIQDIYNILDTKLPGITGKALYNQISEMMPKYQGVPEEEKGFLATERGFAERGADTAMRKAGDVYELGVGAAGRAREAGLGQLQAGAGKLGAQMRGAYGGMGGGARGAVGGQASIAKGFGATQDVYGAEMKRLGKEKGYAHEGYSLAMDKARFTEEKGVYGLEKAAMTAYETDLGTAISNMPGDVMSSAGPDGIAGDDPSTPNVDEGLDDLQTTEFGSWREGGRVPNKGESFSYFLTQLPDAGGM